MTKPTPSVPARRRSPFTRLLLAAALLLPAAIHAQAPLFPLRNSGLVRRPSNLLGPFAPEVLDGRLRSVSPNYALTAQGEVRRAENGEIVLTKISWMAELPDKRLLAVDATSKLVAVLKGGESLPSILANLTHVTDITYKVNREKPSTGYGEVYGFSKVTRFAVTSPFKFETYGEEPSKLTEDPDKGRVVSVPGATYHLEDPRVLAGKQQDLLSRFQSSQQLRIESDVQLGLSRGSDNSALINAMYTAMLGIYPGAIGNTPTVVPIYNLAEMSGEEKKRLLQSLKPATAQPAHRAARAARAQAAANPLETGSAIFFGRAPTGTTSAAHQRTVTITNRGAGTMTLGTVTVDGANPADFAVTQPATTALDSFESVEFAVQFTPGEDGARTATLHIPSNDEDKPSFDLDLNGFGQATNATPVAAVDTLTAPAGGETTFTKLLANDTDADTDPIKIVSVAEIDGTTEGSVSFDAATGLVAYTSPDEVGTDVFEYTITDGTETVTGTVNVNLVDPVPLAAGLSFRGEEEGDSTSVTFGKLTPAAAAARKARRSGVPRLGGASAGQLTATFTELIGGRSYKGRVSFDAEDNNGSAVLSGSEDNARTSFEISVDEDGHPLVFSDGIELRPDSFDRKHPAPAELVGTYTMSLPGTSLDGFFEHGVGDSVASVTLSADGSVKIAGVMADGQPFIGSAQLGAENIAPFNIPLYRGKARGYFSGEIAFVGSDAPDGSLTGHATWRKPFGIAGLPESKGFTASGDLVGGFYTPEELPGSLAINFNFGPNPHTDVMRATGAGTLAKKFALTGTLVDTSTFQLDSALTLKTGLILGKRPKKATTGPKSFTGVILQEQNKVGGSAVFTDPGIAEIDIAPSDFTAPVTGTFPP